MGVSDKKLYDRFAELNRRVIKPAIKEINAVSDIQIILETFKEGRSVKALQFQVIDNPNQNQPQIPGVEDKVEMHNALENPVVQQCIKMGV